MNASLNEKITTLEGDNARLKDEVAFFLVFSDFTLLFSTSDDVGIEHCWT